MPSHISLVDPFGPGVTELQADLCSRKLCTKSTIRFQAGTCSGRYMPVQPGEIRPSRVTHVISVKTKPAPPSAREPRCTRWKSLRHAVDRAVHVHGRNDNAVAQHHAAQTNRREHRRDGRIRREPSLDSLDVGSIAQPKVFVTDPLAAGEQAVGELFRRKVCVAGDVLEPLGRVARRVLQFEYFELPQGFVLGQRRLEAPLERAAHRPNQSRLPSPASSPNRPKNAPYARRHPSRRHFLNPSLVADPRMKFSQSRPREVGAVGHQACPCRYGANSRSQNSIVSWVSAAIQPVSKPRLLPALHDEGAQLGSKR